MIKNFKNIRFANKIEKFTFGLKKGVELKIIKYPTNIGKNPLNDNFTLIFDHISYICFISCHQ